MWRFRSADHEFREFVHQIDQLNVAVDLLVLCGKTRTWTEVMAYCQEHGIPRARSISAVRFLYDQDLLTRKETARRDTWGHPVTILKAVPRAVDELVYRLAHDGMPSPARNQDPETAHRIARDKVNNALRNAGYRDNNKSTRRLRVVS